jgi:YD repeat-containing protein
MEVNYNPKTKFVSSLKARDGVTTKYVYDSNPKNPENHYWTVVSKQGEDSKWIDNRYEYEIKHRPDGSQYTYRILTEVNGLKTETIYSECCSLPLKITRGKHVTTFDYNDKGLLTKKTSTKGDYVELEYHKEFNKITRVVNNKGWTTFEYDKKGNLGKAVNSDGKSVLLIYDLKGHITKMVDHDKKSNQKRTLSFKYNAMGKPVEIAMDQLGTINVAYDNYGEIKKVDSKAGHKMALQVTQAFQTLLSIVKPAGVNLNM